MSLDEGKGKLGIPAAILIAALAGCDKEAPEKPPQPLVEVQTEVANRLANIARVDMFDGLDDLKEDALSADNRDFLRKLDSENPQGKRNLLLRLRQILREKKFSQTQGEAERELEILDLVALEKMLNLRDKVVSPEGLVQFPNEELEVSTSLANLTPDDEILFSAGEKTQSKMGIAATAPFKAFRLKQPTKVRVGNKEIVAQPGTFVVEVGVEAPTETSTETVPKTPPVKSTDLFKVFIYSGDKIIDSLSGDFTPREAMEKLDTSQEFERFLHLKMADFPIETARQIFHNNYSNYERIFKEEYKELLIHRGLKFDQHFVYFIQWAHLNRLPINEDSIRAFLDTLAERKIPTQADYEAASPTQKPSAEEEKILDNAGKALKGEKDQDEDMLSYHDQRVKSESDRADILREKHGPLFAIVRLQGRFFDNYTYNRLTGNYSAKVGATVVGDQEYLTVYNITEGSDLGKTPQDIRAKIRPSSFVEKINATTTYNASTDTALKKALAFSESKVGQASSPQDFNVEYNPNGAISAITFKGTQYSPPTFIAPPDSLKQISGDNVSFTVGGIQITMNLQHYFDRYHALEAKNRGVSQQIILYDKVGRKTDRIRNPNWFVEEGDGFYKQIAEQITAGLTDPHEKLFAIGKWLQTNLNYLEEASEINKLTLATFMDHGGDCEDSYSAFKTLANAIGLGNYVGGIVFKDHVATTIKGNHGQTTYTINGEAWTIFETATDGQTLEAGKTSRKNPLIYILPDGKIISASEDIVPLNIVPISEIDGGLIGNFNQAIEALKKFIEDPARQPSEEALDKNENILEESETLLKAIVDTYTTIASNGKTADALVDQLDSTIRKYKEFLQRWGSFMSKQIGDAKKLELKNAPEKIQKSAQRFDEANTHFTRNLIQTGKKLLELLKTYQGKEKDKAASLATHNAMVDIINASGVALDVDHMETEYEDTLQHADPEIAAEAKKVMENRMDILNKYIYGSLNIVRGILRAHSGE